MRSRLAFVFALALTAALVMPTAAMASKTGRIAGTVKAKVFNLPISGVTVKLYNYDARTKSWVEAASGLTDQNGAYEFTPITGDYRLGFSATGYAGEFYPDAQTVDSAQTIQVNADPLPAPANAWLAQTDNAVNGNGVSVAEEDNGMTVSFASTASPSDGSDAFSGSRTSTMKLRGDYDIQVDYQLSQWPVGVRHGFWVVGGSLQRINDGGLDQYLVHAIGDSFYSVPTLDTSGTLRWTRQGTTASAYYLGADGWVLVAQANLAEAVDTPIVLSSWAHTWSFTSNQPFVGSFSNFKVNSATALVN